MTTIQTGAINSQQINDKVLLSAADIDKISVLAALKPDATMAENFASSMNNILNLMAQLKAFDTTGVEPLKNPFEVAQPLRADVNVDDHARDLYQNIAPQTQNGLFLVPKVIE